MSEINKPTNRLLAAVPQKEFKELAPHLEKVALNYNENIYEAGEVIKHVYFPESGIISLLSRVDAASSIEVGIVGSEGLAGLPVFLGVKTSGNVAVVQGAGSALRLTAADFLAACSGMGKLTAIIQRFIHSLFIQISQSAACNRFHPIEERLARWLLMTQDRMHASEFQITQEFLSNMLGVRREAVNKAAGSLHNLELISYVRGKLTINDRKGLEKAACPCYWIIKHEYETAAT
jgi:CRP-like cAMP-binding protein